MVQTRPVVIKTVTYLLVSYDLSLENFIHICKPQSIMFKFLPILLMSLSRIQKSFSLCSILRITYFKYMYTVQVFNFNFRRFHGYLLSTKMKQDNITAQGNRFLKISAEP